MQKHRIYTQMERRGNRLGGGETESVCERQRVAKNRVGVCCKHGCWGVTNYFEII